MSDAAFVGSELVRLTSDPSQLTYSDVAYCSVVLESLAAMTGGRGAGGGDQQDMRHDPGQDMMAVANNMMRTDAETIKRAQRANNAANRLLCYFI